MDQKRCGQGPDDRHSCGHTTNEHEHMELGDLVAHVQMIENPRLAVILTDAGEIHFASSIPPGEAAAMLVDLAQRIRRYGANYVRDHFDRGHAAQWN